MKLCGNNEHRDWFSFILFGAGENSQACLSDRNFFEYVGVRRVIMSASGSSFNATVSRFSISRFHRPTLEAPDLALRTRVVGALVVEAIGSSVSMVKRRRVLEMLSRGVS